MLFLAILFIITSIVFSLWLSTDGKGFVYTAFLGCVMGMFVCYVVLIISVFGLTLPV